MFWMVKDLNITMNGICCGNVEKYLRFCVTKQTIWVNWMYSIVKSHIICPADCRYYTIFEIFIIASQCTTWYRSKLNSYFHSWRHLSAQPQRFSSVKYIDRGANKAIEIFCGYHPCHIKQFLCLSNTLNITKYERIWTQISENGTLTQ